MRTRNTLLSLFLSNLLIGAIIVVIIGIGWIANIYKLTKCDFKEPYKSEVLRGVGIVVFPAGALFGYLKLKDGDTIKMDEDAEYQFKESPK